MEIIALLPKPKGGEWPPKDKIGIHEISDLDYQRNLCENYFNAGDFGTPSPLAKAIVFVQHLERYLEDVKKNKESDFVDDFQVWVMILKGIYFGLIKFRSVNIHDLRDVGKILTSELPEGFDLQLIYYKLNTEDEEKVIGFTYPYIGFVPSVRLKDSLINEINDQIQKRDIEKASEYFCSWARCFEEKNHGNLLFYILLYHLVEKWNPKAPTILPIEIDKLFEIGPQLWLHKGDFPDEITHPQLYIYSGTPVVCDKCGHQIGIKEGVIEIREPDDCRCPECMKQQNWLGKYGSWLKYNEIRGCYLIYAFYNSPLKLPPFSNCVLFEENGIMIKSGPIQLKVYGLVLSEENLKCNRLIFFKDGERIKRPDLPVRGEYFGLVSLSHRPRNPYLDPVKKTFTVTLNVVGWDEPITIRYDSNQYEYEEALLLSWPNFKLQGWNIYYYLLATTPPMYKAGIGLRVLAENGHHQLLDSTRGNLEMDFGAFEIVFIKNEEQIHLQSGIFCVHRNEIQRGDTKLTLAVDFGTSSSSITYQLGDGPIEILRYTDFTEEVIPNSLLSERVLNSSSWLPTYKIDNPQVALKYYRSQLDNPDSIFEDGDKIVEKLNYFIPSEVICSMPISSDSINHPLSGFRICHVYAVRPQDEIFFEIKLMDEKGDPEGRYSYEQIVSRYLDMFLILSIATILNNKQKAGFLHIKASFPRNFKNEKIKIYLQCLTAQLNNIKRVTGLRTNKILFLDESRAAAYSASAQGSGLRVVMDMGGGTTDIGIFEKKEGHFVPVYVDSLLYGANSYLRMLAKHSELFPKLSVELDNRLLWLFREIRLRSFESVVRTNYRGNKHSQEVALDLLLRFYKPIAYFIARLFDALNVKRGNSIDNENNATTLDLKNEPVTLYLVGNGWSLADAHDPILTGFKKGHKEIIRYLLEKVGFRSIDVTSEPVADDSLSIWPGPKAAVGFGLMKAPENVFYKSIDEVCADNNGIQSILGFDVKFNDGSNRFIDLKWNEPIPCLLDTNIHKPVLDDIQIPKEWNFIDYQKGKQVSFMEEICGKDVVHAEKPILERSILARFLENIYLKQLDNERRF